MIFISHLKKHCIIIEGEQIMEIIKTQKGNLTILAGKTDMGKSTITVYDCSEQLREGKSVIFFSYEYCQSIIYNKMISHFNLKWSDLFKFNMVDASNISFDGLKRIIEAKKGNVDIVYIDYLDLLTKATFGDESKDKEAQTKHIQMLVKDLAQLADDMNIAIVLLSQVGASSDFEKTVNQLNDFSSKAKRDNVIKMFIGKGNVIDSRINYDDISHLILIDGYNLKHFSSINIKEIYKGDK